MVWVKMEMGSDKLKKSIIIFYKNGIGTKLGSELFS
jgi:hypothetical protein